VMKREPIPVKLIRFMKPMDGPGLSMSSSCQAESRTNRRRVQIDYLPWLQQFLVKSIPVNGDVRTGMIWVGHAMYWEPVEPAATASPESDPAPPPKMRRKG